MIERYFEGIVPPAGEYTERDLEIQRIVADAASGADAAIERFAIQDAIERIWTIVDALNGYITENEPWALAKDDAQRERLGTVLYTCAEGLRALAVLLSPVMPVSTEKLWIALGAADALGRLHDQPIREAGRVGHSRAGHERQRARAAVPARRSHGMTDPRPTCASAPRKAARNSGIPPLRSRSRAGLRQPRAPRDRRRRRAAHPRRAARSRPRGRGARRRAGRRRHRVLALVGGCRGIPPPRARGRRDPPERGAGIRGGGRARPGDRGHRRARGAAAGARDRRDGARLLPHRRGRVPRAVRELRGAHRPRQEARDRDADPRPRRPRRGARDADAGRRARAHRVPLLQRRRRHGPRVRRGRLLPVLRGQHHLQERAEPARRARRSRRASACSSRRMPRS